MKESRKKPDITTPILDKCKQIAELWRVEIYEGCWILISRKLQIVTRVMKTRYYAASMLWGIKDGTPIPSISDCLEKLRELNALSAFGGKASVAIASFLMGQITLQQLHLALLSVLLECLQRESREVLRNKEE